MLIIIYLGELITVYIGVETNQFLDFFRPFEYDSVTQQGIKNVLLVPAFIVLDFSEFCVPEFFDFL